MKRLYIIAIFILFFAGADALAQEIELSGAEAIMDAYIEAAHDTTAILNDTTAILNDTAAAANDAAEPLKDKAGKPEKKPTKGLLFFYRTGNWVDRYLTRGIDTSYIGLPEHSWRLAYTNGMVGVHSTITSFSENPVVGSGSISLLNKTTPSVDLGFNAGYRGFGFGYSWDALNAYARRFSFSLGSKFIGIDFSMHTSTNIQTKGLIGSTDWDLPDNNVTITNANLNVWYALNAAHYSHQAAVKQSYIQKKTAGSLLLHISYMSSQIQLSETLKFDEDAPKPLFPSLMSGISAIRTRQIAVGIGYGINYTPNKGKVLLHASANAMLVAYSVNHVSYHMPDSIVAEFPDQAMFNIESSSPVHVTGNVRAAVSWEISKWVHLSAWATGDHIRFKSKMTKYNNYVTLSNWNWKVQLTVGVRFGAGKDRIQRALGQSNQPSELSLQTTGEPKKSRVPKWITDFFWSPKY